MLRSVLVGLFLALFVLLTANSTLIGGYVLAGMSDDPTGQQVFWWLMMAGLVLTALDLVLIVAALALEQIRRSEDPAS